MSVFEREKILYEKHMLLNTEYVVLEKKFLLVFQKELQNIAHLWNTHIIRQSRKAFAARDVYPSTAFWWTRSSEVLEQAEPCKGECLRRGPYTCDDTVFSLSCLLWMHNFLHVPSTSDEAVELYLF